MKLNLKEVPWARLAVATVSIIGAGVGGYYAGTPAKPDAASVPTQAAPVNVMATGPRTVDCGTNIYFPIRVFLNGQEVRPEKKIH